MAEPNSLTENLVKRFGAVDYVVFALSLAVSAAIGKNKVIHIFFCYLVVYSISQTTLTIT